MTDARDDAPESVSGEPLDTDPTDLDTDEGAAGREPYDADGVIEPERDSAEPDAGTDPDAASDPGAGTDDIAAEPLGDDLR